MVENSSDVERRREEDKGRKIYFRFLVCVAHSQFSCKKHSQKPNQIDTNSQIATINTGSPLCKKSLARIQRTIKLY